MLVSFYRPTASRYKILVDKNPFPSDRYALATHLATRGVNSKEAVIEMEPRPGEECLRVEDILKTIDDNKSSLALVLLGHVNFVTGQAFPAKEIAIAAKKAGSVFGLDLAHSIGNVPLAIHDWQCDFAVWCYYKYMNGGPGISGGCFIHEKYVRDQSIPRYAGWFGHNLNTRLQMPKEFDPSLDASGWQLSNSPILQLAALETSLEIFDRLSMPKIREKSENLTGFLFDILSEMNQECRLQIITPRRPEERGSQLSIRSLNIDAKALCNKLSEDVVCDAREPNILRLAPTALYNSFAEVVGACEKIYSLAKGG